MRKPRYLGTVLASFFMLTSLASSCSLLPVEEEAPPPPVIRSFETEEYKLTEVKKGDIVETAKIYCQYSPAVEEKLSFGKGGLLIENVYVSNGDTVKKGDVLAELDAGTLPSQIENQSLEINKLELSRSHLTNTYEYDYASETVKLEALREELETAAADRRNSLEAQIEAQEKAIEALKNNYQLQLEVYNTRIRTASLKLADLQSQLDKRKLVAGIDGTVTYIKDTDPFTMSVEKELFITISDKTSSVFIISGDDASYFRLGDKVEVLLSKDLHAATVINAAELGLEEADRIVYVKLDEAVFDLKDRSSGTITLELDRKDDVLYINSNAVKSANGKSIVYLLSEDGIKTMREVVTGFTAENKTEIISGLELGEQIILE